MNKYINILFKRIHPLLRTQFFKYENKRKHCSQSITYNRFLQDLPKTQCSILSSGLTIATEERNCLNVCLGLYIDAGTRNENKLENGITHFFEHIAFKGSNSRSKTDLENEISKSGAKFKCFTNRDYTAYSVECTSSEVTHVAEILFDCLFNNAFSDAEIEIQKDTVYQEMLRHDKSTDDILYDYLHLTAFQGTQLGQTIMGPSSNLNNFKSASISDYIKVIFSTRKIVLAAVGCVKHDLMLNVAEMYFKEKINTTDAALGPARYTGSQIVFRDDSMNAAHIAIAVEGPSFKSDDTIIMKLASSILGGWDISQPGGKNHGVNLANIASAGSLCESYKTFCINYRDVGLWGIEYISAGEEVDDMLLTVQKEWMRLCHLITDGELIRAKNEMKSKFLRKVLSTAGACHDIGLNFLYMNYRPEVCETIKAIDKITAKDLKYVCDYYIYDRCPVVVGIGSTEALLPYSRVRGYMYWMRV